MRIVSMLSLRVQLKENDMRTTVTQWATKAAGAGAIVLLLATPFDVDSIGGYRR